MLNRSGIYEIKNVDNDYRYIGRSVDIPSRLYDHKLMLRNGTHHSQHLQRAWDKYGSDSFEFKPLLKCDPNMCRHYEQVCLDELNREYNVYTSADGRDSGMKHSEETKRKLREFNLGKKRSPEHRRNIGLGGIGRKHSKKTRDKMSKALTGRVFTDEHLRKLSESHLGQVSSKRCNEISYADVDDIKNQYNIDGDTQEVIGKRYGVSRYIIGRVLNSTHWTSRSENVE